MCLFNLSDRIYKQRYRLVCITQRKETLIIMNFLQESLFLRLYEMLFLLIDADVNTYISWNNNLN
jgi:hypothetical protein